MNSEFLDPLAQGGAGDAQQLGGLHLVVLRFLQRFNDEFAFDGRNDLELGIALGDLEKLTLPGFEPTVTTEVAPPKRGGNGQKAGQNAGQNAQRRGQKQGQGNKAAQPQNGKRGRRSGAKPQGSGAAAAKPGHRSGQRHH